ncbi:MAG: 6-bladed beta-propeller [Pseudomonadota bacterium]
MRTYDMKAVLSIFLIGLFFHSGPAANAIEGKYQRLNKDQSKSSDKTELVLSTEFVISNAGNTDEYLFVSPVDLDIDRNGNIYVLDSGDCKIKVFDSNGNYTFSFGSKGQGPGEFQSPASINITESNEVMVYDLRIRRISLFSLLGIFKNQKNVSSIFSMNRLKTNTENDPYAILIERDKFSIVKFKKDFSSSEVIKERQFDLATESQPSTHLLSPSLFYCLTNTYLVCGYSDKYELEIMNFQGNVINKIQKKYTPTRVSKDMKDHVINLLTSGRGFPKNWNVIEPEFCPSFMNLSADDKGRIFVGTFERPKNEPGSFYFDVYDQKGSYISKFPLEIRDYRHQLKWKNNKLYIIDIDDEGSYFVKKIDTSWN